MWSLLSTPGFVWTPATCVLSRRMWWRIISIIATALCSHTPSRGSHESRLEGLGPRSSVNSAVEVPPKRQNYDTFKMPHAPLQRRRKAHSCVTAVPAPGSPAPGAEPGRCPQPPTPPSERGGQEGWEQISEAELFPPNQVAT